MVTDSRSLPSPGAGGSLRPPIGRGILGVILPTFLAQTFDLTIDRFFWEPNSGGKVAVKVTTLLPSFQGKLKIDWLTFGNQEIRIPGTDIKFPLISGAAIDTFWGLAPDLQKELPTIPPQGAATIEFSFSQTDYWINQWLYGNRNFQNVGWTKGARLKVWGSISELTFSKSFDVTAIVKIE